LGTTFFDNLRKIRAVKHYPRIQNVVSHFHPNPANVALHALVRHFFQSETSASYRQ